MKCFIKTQQQKYKNVANNQKLNTIAKSLGVQFQNYMIYKKNIAKTLTFLKDEK